MEKLKRSHDRKTQYSPRVANTFGLSSHTSCPAETGFCACCYSSRIERGFKGARLVVQQNYEQLQGKTTPQMRNMIGEMLDEFESECDKKSVEKVFRIHWSGDLFSRDYARAWAQAIKLHPAIQAWVYTRSFNPEILDVVKYFKNIPNLVLYLSIDAWNIEAGRKAMKRYPWALVAACGMTWLEAKAIMNLLEIKGPKCPVENKSLPLVDKHGKGGCALCELCIHGRNNVMFSNKKGPEPLLEIGYNKRNARFM